MKFRPGWQARVASRLFPVAIAAAALAAACGPKGSRDDGPTGATGRGGSGRGGTSGNPTGGNGNGNGMPSGGASGGNPSGGAGPGMGGSNGGGVTDGPPGSGTDGPGPGPSGQATLPLIVTERFTNQGWFGDANIAKAFRPGATVIRQVPSTTGPCAARQPGARGQCLQVTVTPPSDYVPPGKDAHVGLFMLTTLKQAHPMANPPARAGEPNWGLEPGAAIAPGARRVTFYAAGDRAGLTVSFRAGAEADDIYLPERTETMDTSWTPITMSLVGGQTGADIVGGFAWKLKELTRPVTFYLDNIVWDEIGEAPARLPAGKRDNVREFLFINDCNQTIWVGGWEKGNRMPGDGGFRLDAGQRRTITIPGGRWEGRFWGRTGCNFDAAGGTCETGRCAGGERCTQPGEPPVTLAEITLSGDNINPDFYDISIVDGYNLPMAFGPLPGSHLRNAVAPVDCLVPTCVSDLNQTCPGELREAVGGRTVACASACKKLGRPEFCCTGAFDQPETCPPFDFARTFKAACPSAYSYAYDDTTSTFTCKGEDYGIWFCPKVGP